MRLVNLAYCPIITIAIALLGLVSYTPGLAILGSLGSDYIPMAPSTAASFIILATFSIITRPNPSLRVVVVSLLFAIAVALFSGLEVLGHFTNQDLNFEDTFVPEFGELHGVPVARMSPSTGAFFFISSLVIILLLAASLNRRKTFIEDCAGFLAILVLGGSLTFMLGYFYGTPFLYDQRTIPMALTTALGFFFLSMGLFANLSENSFPNNLFLGTSTRARLMRFFLPLCFAAVLMQGLASSLLVSLTHINSALISAFIVTLVIAIAAIAVNKVSQLIGNQIDHSEKEMRQAEDNLRKSENTLKRIFELSPDMIGTADANDGCLKQINPAWEKVLGRPAQELFSRPFMDFVHPDDQEATIQEIAKQKSGETVSEFKNRYRCKDGSYKSIEWRATAAQSDGTIYAVGRDITDRNKVEEEKEKLEAQLRQSHKMEAVGVMAGGIAHDFNNILSAVVGYAELLKDEVPRDSQARKDVDQILVSSERAVRLVKQILAFSRKEEQKLIPIRPHTVIKETMKLLRSTIPTTTEIHQNIDSQCGAIYADPTKIHQILMNLCSNAVHAMNEKGIIEVNLAQVELTDEDLSVNKEIIPGPYMRLSVADNGTGIDVKTRERIFDPFFTTKEQGKGTGMGLSVVHGIVKSHNGMVTVDSEPGKGTTFNVFIPVIEGAEEMTITARTEDLPSGDEKILFVDDEEILSILVTRTLGALGYRLTSFTNSADALATFRSKPDEFDLVMTDQTMPGMSGAELTTEILKIRPDMPIIICTGYSSKVSEEDFMELGASEFIMKPYEKNNLAQTVRKVLDKNI